MGTRTAACSSGLTQDRVQTATRNTSSRGRPPRRRYSLPVLSVRRIDPYCKHSKLNKMRMAIPWHENIGIGNMTLLLLGADIDFGAGGGSGGGLDLLAHCRNLYSWADLGSFPFHLFGVGIGLAWDGLRAP